MYKKSILAIILIATITTLTFSSASAQSPITGGDINKMILSKAKTAPPKKEKKKEAKPTEPVAPVNPVYEVTQGDNLTKIAEAYNTTVDRLWQKNTDISNPDFIDVSDKVIIPLPDEALTDRPLPVPVAIVNSSAPVAVSRGSTEGNTYTPGYCTWYVKNMRPDLPNSWGNASSWYGKAQAMGYAVGSTPRVGAVAWHGGGEGHVALVTGVVGDMVTITEMNHEGWNIVDTRTTAASTFLYIY